MAIFRMKSIKFRIVLYYCTCACQTYVCYKFRENWMVEVVGSSFYTMVYHDAIMLTCSDPPTSISCVWYETFHQRMPFGGSKQSTCLLSVNISSDTSSF